MTLRKDLWINQIHSKLKFKISPKRIKIDNTPQRQFINRTPQTFNQRNWNQCNLLLIAVTPQQNYTPIPNNNRMPTLPTSAPASTPKAEVELDLEGMMDVTNYAGVDLKVFYN